MKNNISLMIIFFILTCFDSSVIQEKEYEYYTGSEMDSILNLDFVSCLSKKHVSFKEILNLENVMIICLTDNLCPPCLDKFIRYCKNRTIYNDYNIIIVSLAVNHNPGIRLLKKNSINYKDYFIDYQYRIDNYFSIKRFPCIIIPNYKNKSLTQIPLSKKK